MVPSLIPRRPGRRLPDSDPSAGSRDQVAASRPASLRLGEAELLSLYRGVPGFVLLLRGTGTVAGRALCAAVDRTSAEGGGSRVASGCKRKGAVAGR